MTAFLLAAALVVAPATAQAPGDTVRYEISFPNAAHHEAQVTVRFSGVTADTLELRMSRSSPGRYALHEFGKNVYDVRAVDGAGRPLPLSRPDPHQWNVTEHDGTVQVSYTLFANRADGTYTGIDVTHAHMNMPATFMWARGTQVRPIAITFNTPAGSAWRVATQLKPTADPFRFVAPHLQYFLDSPTELSAFDVRAWRAGDDAQTVRIAMHHLGTDTQLDEYAAHTRRIVQEQAAVFGALPQFDYGTYTFIVDYLPWVAGDGMEHRNSTIVSNTGSLEDVTARLGTVAHEFFHAWNVERLRPADLEPFDFERANMSGALWFAEGFTSYYGPLTMRRAGVLDDASYAAGLTGMLNTVISSPGRRYFSPVEMSMQAPFVDAATAVDPNNRANTFISYYTWGAAIGLGLDLTLRTRFDLTLDDFMRAMWERFGQHQRNHAPARPYTLDDLRATLAAVTGDAGFARAFFDSYIHGSDVVDYGALLARAGLLLRHARPDSPTIGAPALVVQGDAIIVAGPVLAGSPLYAAGVDAGDRLIAMDGRPVTSPADVTARVAAKRPGDPVEITFEQRNVRSTATVEVAADPALEVVLYEEAGLPVTPAMRAFRHAWLAARVGS